MKSLLNENLQKQFGENDFSNVYLNKVSTTKLYIKIPKEYRTIKLMKYQIKNVFPNKINQVYRDYRHMDIPDDIIIMFLERGGNFKYVNKNNLSENIWNIATQKNSKNLLYIPSLNYMTNIKRLIKLFFYENEKLIYKTIFFSYCTLFCIIIIYLESSYSLDS